MRLNSAFFFALVLHFHFANISDILQRGSDVPGFIILNKHRVSDVAMLTEKGKHTSKDRI